MPGTYTVEMPGTNWGSLTFYHLNIHIMQHNFQLFWWNPFTSGHSHWWAASALCSVDYDGSFLTVSTARATSHNLSKHDLSFCRLLDASMELTVKYRGNAHSTFAGNWKLENGHLTYNLHNSQVWEMIMVGAWAKWALLRYFAVKGYHNWTWHRERKGRHVKKKDSRQGLELSLLFCVFFFLPCLRFSYVGWSPACPRAHPSFTKRLLSPGHVPTSLIREPDCHSVAYKEVTPLFICNPLQRQWNGRILSLPFCFFFFPYFFFTVFLSFVFLHFFFS